MRTFQCTVCDSALFFENSVCVSCGSALGFSREQREIVALAADGSYTDEEGLIWHVCRNLGLSGCTWLCQQEGGQCTACDLTRTRPSDDDRDGLEQFLEAERAKRYLVYELDGLGIPLLPRAESPGGDPERGLCIDLLSSSIAPVVTGHDEGVITIDLAEADDSHREAVRNQLGEPYRTVLGHFRHEVGHYIEWRYVEGTALLAEAREAFGDESTDYTAAIERHYEQGAPAGWEEDYISAYATMHPYEDFAETWAHYLHICDSIDTARHYGLSPAGDIADTARFSEAVRRVWLPLATALNMMNRAMGKHDLYPFVLADGVCAKLDTIARLRRRIAAAIADAPGPDSDAGRPGNDVRLAG